MGTRLTGRRRWQLLPRGSELELERWPGAGTRGSLRRHLRVGSSRGRSRSGGRSRGRSEEGACELPRAAGAGTPQTLGGSSSGETISDAARSVIPSVLLSSLPPVSWPRVGLVWMQVALKEDLDTLKEKFRTMESNQKSSFQEIPKLNEELLSKQRELEKIESGELGLNKVWINITEMNKQISLLNSAVNHLKANVKSAADLISLPATVEGLQKSVASIGNTLNSVHLAVEAIQKTVDEHKKAMELLQSDLNQYAVKETSRSDQIIPSPSAPSELDNKPPSENVKQIGDRAATLKRESLHQVTSRVDTVKTQSIKKEDSSDSQVSKLREKLQLISALSNKPESNRPPETTHEEQVQSFTSKPSAFPEFPQSPGDDIEKTAQLRSISLPGIASIKDLEDLFYKTGQNMDEKLTYQEIWNSLGSAMPAPESLREFDADGDGRYSFLELRAAVGV